jgi:hypothetical protein
MGFALAGLMAAGIGLSPDLAFAKGLKEKRDLVAPRDGFDRDAEGDLKASQKKNRRTFKIKVRNLEPKTTYRVLDNDGVLLGTFRTNKRGKGKVKLSRDLGDVRIAESHAKDSPVDDNHGKRDGGDDGAGTDVWDDFWFCIEITHPDSDAPVLKCYGVDEDENGDPVIPEERDEREFAFEAGWGDYGTDDFWGMSSLTYMKAGDEIFDAFDFSIIEFSEDGRSMTVHEFWAYGGTDAGLPLGVRSVRDLAGRAFAVTNLDGRTVMSGDLPEMEDFGGFKLIGPIDLFGEWMVPDVDDMWMPPASDLAPEYVLRIANDRGELVEVAELQRWEMELWFPMDDCPWLEDDHHDDEGGDDRNTDRSTDRNTDRSGNFLFR